MKKLRTENFHVRQFQCRRSYHPQLKTSVDSPQSFFMESCFFAIGRFPVLEDQLPLAVPSHLRKSEER